MKFSESKKEYSKVVVIGNTVRDCALSPDTVVGSSPTLTTKAKKVLHTI